MSLALWHRPRSSFSWKLLIALYESGLDFDRRQLDLSRADERAALAQLSPMGKMPMLVAGDRALAESSVIIEWLAIHHPAAPRPGPRRPRGRAGCANVGPDRRPAPGRAAAG